MSSVQGSFDALEKNIQANTEKATSVNALYGFQITGDGGGEYLVNLKEGAEAPFVVSGTTEGANVVITVGAADWLGILSGAVNPMQAFMMGKIKVQGDMGLAMKLQSILSMAS